MGEVFKEIEALQSISSNEKEVDNIVKSRR